MLTVDRVSFSWHGKQVLDSVSFAVQRGEIVALLGPNGAGKTTLLRCILGQLRPASGEIRAHDDSPAQDGNDTPLISWVPQRVTVFPLLTAAQNLTEFARIMGVPGGQIGQRVQDVLSLIGLEHRANDLARTLSGGMQRMLNVGIGLVSNPRILLIDEPTAGIDQAAQERLHELLAELKAKGLAVLLTTHDLDDVSRLASQAVILVNGQVRAAGTVDDLIHQRFTDQMEVSVRLVGEVAARSAMEHEFSRLGLAPLGDGGWTGLINTTTDQLERLNHHLLAQENLIGDFSLHKPGLELLISSLLDDSGPRS